MSKTFKKVLSVVLSLAMIATSITVYNTTAKADEPVEFTVTATKRADGNGIDANWEKPEGFTQITDENPDGDYATLAYYLNKADEVALDADHYATAANGWCWTNANKTEDRVALDTVTQTSNAALLNVTDGGAFVIVVQYIAADGTVVAQGTSNAVEFEEVVNTNLNLRQDRVDEANKVLFLKWDLIKGAARYEIINADTNEVLITKNAGDWEQFAYEDGKTYNYIMKVYNAAGEEIEVENNTFTFSTEVPDNFDAAMNVVYAANVAKISWKAITGAASYVVSVDGNETTVTDTKMDVTVEANVVYNVSVKALNENGEEIAITNNAVEVQYVPEGAPADHDISKVDTSSWTALDVKAGTSENSYSINAAHGLSTAVWWGIYAPHSDAAYHGERTNCILGDAAGFVFQQSNVKEIWVNGNKYANPSTAFNNQGDCAEISVDVLTEKQNVITLVLNDDTMKTFAIKVAEPMGPDATEDASQTVIDPDSIEDWVALAGTSTNGSTAYISAAAGDNMGNAGLRGFYAAGQSANWNISDAMKAVPVFGFVATNDNASSIIIDGVEYVNAKDARNTKVFIGADCVYINDSLLEAPTGETVYHTITAVGSKVGTFVVKVVGPEEVVVPEVTVTVDGAEVAVEDGKVTLGDAEYGYLCDGKMYAPNTAVEVVDGMAFTSVNELSVTMANGAGIRYAGTAGIRFQASITSDNMDAVASSAVTEGTLITAKDIYDAKGTALTLTSDYTKIDVKNSGWFQGTVGTYCGSICDIVESNYIRNFIARAYVTVNYENADAVTIYSNMGPTRSISQVAAAVKAAGYPGIPTDAQSTIDSFIK